MKIEAEKMGERFAAEELVRELVRNDARRGEFMIMSDDEDEERFVQIACDYDEVGGKSDGLSGLGDGGGACRGHPRPKYFSRLRRFRQD